MISLSDDPGLRTLIMSLFTVTDPEMARYNFDFANFLTTAFSPLLLHFLLELITQFKLEGAE